MNRKSLLYLIILSLVSTPLLIAVDDESSATGVVKTQGAKTSYKTLTKKEAEKLYFSLPKITDPSEKAELLKQIIRGAPSSFYKTKLGISDVIRIKKLKNYIIKIATDFSEKRNSLIRTNHAKALEYSQSYLELINRALGQNQLKHPKDYKTAILNLYNPEINYVLTFAAAQPAKALPKIDLVISQLKDNLQGDKEYADNVIMAVKNKVTQKVLSLAISTKVSSVPSIQTKIQFLSFIGKNGLPEFLKSNKTAIKKEIARTSTAVSANHSRAKMSGSKKVIDGAFVISDMFLEAVKYIYDNEGNILSEKELKTYVYDVYEPYVQFYLSYGADIARISSQISTSFGKEISSDFSKIMSYRTLNGIKKPSYAPPSTIPGVVTSIVDYVSGLLIKAGKTGKVISGKDE
jgi:hypothetical protein